MPGKRTKLDDLMEAISFAEVGEIDTARGIAVELFREKTAPQAARILAVSRTAGFSRRMVEQSLDMAERMGYGLVALSVVPGMARLVARLRGRRGEKGPSLPPEAFQARAAERGVPFIHTVGKGDPEQAVVAVTHRFRRIAFLLVEPDLVPRTRFTAVPLPVFFLESA
jgi:hypothetical protein